MTQHTALGMRSLVLGAATAGILACGAFGASAQAPENKAQPGKAAPAAASRQAPARQSQPAVSRAPRAAPATRTVERRQPQRQVQSDRASRGESGNAARKEVRQSQRRNTDTAEKATRRNQRVTETRQKVVAKRGDARETSRRTAGSEQNKQSSSTPRKQAERQRSTPKGTPGNATRSAQSKGTAPAVNRQARLDVQQRARFSRALIGQRASHRITRANFTVAIGNRIPRRHRLYAIPAALLAIVPAYYSSYRYVWVDDRICIVDPATYEVVDVIDDTGTGPGSNEQIATLELNPAERLMVIGLLQPDAPRAEIDVGLALGAEIPAVVPLARFPEAIVSDIPRLSRYRYVLVDENVVIANPDNRVVVLVVRR